MPAPQQPIQPPTTFQIGARPGVRRDGTRLDNPFYLDAVWTRFQRGRPRKMGGYALMTDLVSGPIRETYVDSRDIENSAHSFSTSGIERLAFTNFGIGGGVNVRTPAGFVRNDDYLWQAASMFDSGGGGAAALIAAATPDANNIASDTEGPVYSGDLLSASSLFVEVSDGAPITVSGGCCVLQPFLFVFGSNGLIRNSNANDFSAATGWSGADSNTANVAGTKIVRGLPVRGGGQSPAGLFWALDSLIRVSYVGGTVLWNYDTVSSSISVLSKGSVVEYDGIYYWIGVDRFYMYNGVVQELPNDMNLNFFFDNLNPLQRNKVWALKIPRFGEIWWFLPIGTSEECNHAVIYNVREKIWYDTPITRSAGASPQTFTKPIMAGGNATATFLISLAGITGGFIVGEEIAGVTSGATGTVLRVLPTQLNVQVETGTFISGEVVNTASGSGTISATPEEQNLDAIWLHESGVNRIFKQDTLAISASFETPSFQWQSGGPGGGAPAGPDLQTRLVRMEPDFTMVGTMLMTVKGRSFAQSETQESTPEELTSETEFLSPREQRREMSLEFSVNELDSDFEAGRIMVTVEPGDARG